MARMTMHPTTTLTAPDGLAVEIDELLAPMLQQVWRAGIETVSCCQSAGELGGLEAHFPHLAERNAYHSGYAYIDFPGPDDAAAFLTAVANGGPRDAFYVRMVHWVAPGAWRTSVQVQDLADEDDEDAPSVFELGTVKVSFPLPDVDEIAARLARHNAGEPPVTGPTDWSTVEVPDA